VDIIRIWLEIVDKYFALIRQMWYSMQNYASNRNYLRLAGVQGVRDKDILFDVSGGRNGDQE